MKKSVKKFTLITKNNLMQKHNLAIFTVGRSDFGILQNIIKRCELDKRFNLYLVIGSAHKSKIFGNTQKEINSFLS